MNHTNLRNLLAGGLVACCFAGLVTIVWCQDRGAANPRADERAAPAAAATRPADNAGQKENREAAGPKLGIRLQAGADQRPVIAAVEPNSAADRAGLQANDAIISVDGNTFSSPRQLQLFLNESAGGEANFVVERSGRQATIVVNLPEAESRDRAWVGVYLGDEKETAGAQIDRVYPASPASRAGLRQGDVVTQIEGHKIADSTDFVDVIAGMKPQARVALQVERNGQSVEIPVVLGRQPAQFSSGMSRGDGGQGDSRFQGNEDIPPYAMQLEYQRRAAEQNQRIERELSELRDEVHKLRESLEHK